MTTLPPQQCIRGFAGPCRDRPSAILTDILTDIPSFSCPFTESPSILSPRPSPSNEASSSRRHNAFPKIPIPQSAWSTDSEILSDNDHRIGSPSLISSIFSRNPSSSCSTSSHAAPVTPTGSNKPILRRPDCASTSTSASEDGGRLFDALNELGLSNLPSSAHGLSRKRSTLTFAVKCNVTSDSGHSPISSFSRPCRNYSKSPARHLPAWNDVDDEDEEDEDEEEGYDYPSALIDEDSESDDEGYEEDEEGGFTDDEDLVGTFTGLPQRLWVASAKWKARHPSSPRMRRSHLEGSYVSASEDGSCVYQPRGRKISIVTTKPDRCSRHVSPPPSRPSSPPPPSCPPAARSPSAIGLCRRRETSLAQCRDTSESRGRGWRSDDAFGVHCRPSLPVSNPASLAPPTSILRPCSKGSMRLPRTNQPPCSAKIARRVSAPACSNVIIARAHSDAMREGAQRGLEAFLRRGSEKK